MLTVLSILCVIEPLIKVLYFKASTQFDFMVIFANLKAHNSFVEVFDFWLVFPIAGLLILKVRKWTYFAFMSLLTYIVYDIMTYEKFTWPYYSEKPFFYSYVVAGMAAAAFAYFLSPKVREPFFNQRVRWWESRNRYNVQIPCKLHGKNLTFPSHILNISKSGLFLQSSPYLKIGERLEIEFNIIGEIIEVPVYIVHQRSVNGITGYGVKFEFKSLAQSIKMSKVIRVVKASQDTFQEDKTVVA